MKIKILKSHFNMIKLNFKRIGSNVRVVETDQWPRWSHSPPVRHKLLCACGQGSFGRHKARVFLTIYYVKHPGVLQWIIGVWSSPKQDKVTRVARDDEAQGVVPAAGRGGSAVVSEQLPLQPRRH